MAFALSPRSSEWSSTLSPGPNSPAFSTTSSNGGNDRQAVARSNSFNTRRKAAKERAALIKQTNADTQQLRAKLRNFRRSNSCVPSQASTADIQEDAKSVHESLKAMEEVMIAMKRVSSSNSMQSM